MKGIVFRMLSDLVEERYGFDVWDDLLADTRPESEGVYVTTELYPDSELMAYVNAMARRMDVPANDIVFAFGEYMMKRFAEIHPEFFTGHTLKSFLKSVHDTIHVEVRKLHPDAVLPRFDYEDPADDALVMLYRSPRGLCALAEGLISGSAAHFGVAVKTDHPVCMHRGADHCRLELGFAEIENAATG